MTTATMLPCEELRMSTLAATRLGRACSGERLLHRWLLRAFGGRRQRAAADAGRTLPGPRPNQAPRSCAAGGELAEVRAAALRRLFPKLSSWQASPSFGAQMQAAYEELSQAADLDDLARRIRRIEQVAGPGGALRGLAPSPD